jgi:hypothetical protein
MDKETFLHYAKIMIELFGVLSGTQIFAFLIISSGFKSMVTKLDLYASLLEI